jgi:hypothetical protein
LVATNEVCILLLRVAIAVKYHDAPKARREGRAGRDRREGYVMFTIPNEKQKAWFFDDMWGCVVFLRKE